MPVDNAIPLFIYGASGHGKVVAETVRLDRRYRLAGFLDDAPAKQGQTFGGLPVLNPQTQLHDLPGGAVVALGIGSNESRRQVQERLARQSIALATLCHPSAVVPSGVHLGEGTFVAPLALIHGEANVGRGCIVNSGAVVEHDCDLGNWVHVAPHATLGGNVRVGEGTFVGIAAAVLPNLTIGSWTVVGAGSVVNQAIPDCVVCVGVPARVSGPHPKKAD